MTEQNTALVDQAAIDEARAMSGEANVVKFDFTPIIEIDNQMIEEELSGGRKAKVRIQPRFIFTTRDENNEYIKTPFEKPINGIVLKIRYMIDKKYSETDKTPFFRSNEFDSFQGKNVILKSGEEVSPAYTYKEFKEIYDGKYTLWTVAYFLMDTGEGVKKVFKLKMKGVSRSNFWDYMAGFSSDDSITMHETEVAFDVDDTAENPFNFMCLTKTKNPINIQESLKFGRELRDALNSFSTPKATVGEVVEERKEVTPPQGEYSNPPSMLERAMNPQTADAPVEQNNKSTGEKPVGLNSEGAAEKIPF